MSNEFLYNIINLHILYNVLKLSYKYRLLFKIYVNTF